MLFACCSYRLAQSKTQEFVHTLKTKFHQSSRSKTRVFDQAFVLLGLRPAHDKLGTFRVENLVESMLDLSQHVMIDPARFRPNRGSLVTSATYSLRTGSRRAFDLLSTCLRPARARHASLRPGFRPGFRPARLMEFGFNSLTMPADPQCRNVYHMASSDKLCTSHAIIRPK